MRELDLGESEKLHRPSRVKTLQYNLVHAAPTLHIWFSTFSCNLISYGLLLPQTQTGIVIKGINLKGLAFLDYELILEQNVNEITLEHFLKTKCWDMIIFKV